MSNDNPSVPAPDVDLARRYAVGSVTAAEGVRVEQAMERSVAWRGLVGAHIDGGRLDAGLALVHIELDAPRRGIVERSMVRLGMPEHVARLMAATPVLRRSWFLASFLVLFFGIVAAGENRPAPTVAYFLALAPLVPVVGVGVAYGPGIDPAHDMATATPLSGLRLVLLRSVAVVATSVAAGGVCSLVLASQHGLRAIAWILPALALTALVLVVATVLPTRVAAGSVGGLWLLFVAVVARGAGALVLFGPAAQVAYLAAALVGLGLLAVRRGSFEIVEVAS